MGLVNRVVAPPTLAASVAALAADIARAPRGGLAATKEIVAAIRAGARGRESEGYGAALRTRAAARQRIPEFASRRKREPPTLCGAAGPRRPHTAGPPRSPD